MSGAVERVRVAVVFAGTDPDHGGAAQILAALDPARFDAVQVGIAPGADPRALAAGATAVRRALPGPAVDLKELAAVDVVFPVPAPGAPVIDGLLEMAGLPYVGAGVFASAVAADAEFTRKLAAAAGVPVAGFVALRPGDDPAVARRLGLPVRVGGAVVHDWADLPAAVEAARVRQSKVLVEAVVAGPRIVCAVLGGAPPVASRCGLLRAFGGEDLFDVEVPADLPADTAERIRDLAVRAYSALDCAGLARFEFVVSAECLPTECLPTECLPTECLLTGLTAAPTLGPDGLFARLWAASGLDYPALIERLVRTAL